jgi:hypothetical protein
MQSPKRLEVTAACFFLAISLLLRNLHLAYLFGGNFLFILRLGTGLFGAVTANKKKESYTLVVVYMTGWLGLYNV